MNFTVLFISTVFEFIVRVADYDYEARLLENKFAGPCSVSGAFVLVKFFFLGDVTWIHSIHQEAGTSLEPMT